MRRRNLIDAIMHERDPLRLRALFYEWEETRTLADGRKRWKGTGADKGKYRTQKSKPGTSNRSKGHDPDKRRALTARILQLVESPHEVTDDSLAALKDELKGLSREQLAAVRRELNIRRGGRRKGEEIDTIAGHVGSKRGQPGEAKKPTPADKTRAMLEALSGRPDGLYQVGGAHGKLVQVKGGKAQVVNAIPADVQIEAEVKKRQGQRPATKPQPGKQDLGAGAGKAERKKEKPTIRREAEKAVSDDSVAPGVSESDIPYGVALAAHSNTSHVPEKRAKMRQQEYVEQMNADWAHLLKFAKTPEQREQLREEFARYRDGYRGRQIAVLQAASKTASSMITGPANFNVERNRKKLDAEHNRRTDLAEFRERALRAIRKKIAPETGPIKSSESDAVALLQKQVDAARTLQETMKRANATIRSFATFKRGTLQNGPNGTTLSPSGLEYKKGKTREGLLAALVEGGLSKEVAESILQPDFAGRIGFADYQIKNNDANIRRITGRIEEISKMKAGGHQEQSYTGGIRVAEDPDAARVRIHFPGKPDATTIGKLKAGGFRWSPSEGAWQRHLNNGGRYAVQQLLSSIGAAKVETGPTESDDVPPMIAGIDDPEPGAE